MKENRAELKDRLQEALNVRGKKAVDLVNNLSIPKSAISQYLSGKSKNMDSVRLYKISSYLDVSEAWLMGFDVPMEREQMQKKNDAMSDIVIRMRSDEKFMEAVSYMYDLDDEKLESVRQLLITFQK